MTITTIILSLIIISLISIITFLSWYIINAVRQIQSSEQYTLELVEGIEALKVAMETYVSHVHVVNELEMFYGDETLRKLIRHGTALVETFEEYKIDYFPILHIEEEEDDENRSQVTQENS